MRKEVVIYMAGSRDVAGEVDALADLLEQDGARVVSRWHRGVLKLVDPGETMTRQQILAANLEDLAQASLVVAVMDRGAPRATYAEIGMALGAGKSVLWIAPTQNVEDDPRACIFDSHGLVLKVTSVAEARDAVAQIRNLVTSLSEAQQKGLH